MTTYSTTTPVFLDFHFGGKPSGIVTRVIKPGRGNRVTEGEIEVRLTETVGAYRKGELLTVAASVAVPKKQEFKKPGSRFRWVNTDYSFA